MFKLLNNIVNIALVGIGAAAIGLYVFVMAFCSTAEGAEMGPWFTAAKTAVRIGYLNGNKDEFRTIGSGTMIAGKVATAEHVCGVLENFTDVRLVFHGGYMVKPLSWRAAPKGRLDVCAITVPQFVGVQKRWVEPQRFRDGRYGETAINVSMYLEPGWMATGPVGDRMCAKVHDTHFVVRGVHLNVGGGASGSGVFSEDAAYIGMLVHSKLFNTGGFGAGSRVPLGYAAMVPGDDVIKWIKYAILPSQEGC